MGDTVRWEIMLSETDKPLQMLLDAEEENELFDRNMDDIVSDLHNAFLAVVML